MNRRNLLSRVLTRSKSSSPRIDPATLIIESANTDGLRILPLEGAFNFRDLGGYQTKDGRRIKWRQIFRSGSLADLTEHDLDELRSIGLKYVFDLRTADEMSAAPDRIPEGAEYIPLSAEIDKNTASRLISMMRHSNWLERMMLDGYTRVMIEQNAPNFGAILTYLANAESFPAIIHCTAGKDRAGIMSALLLGALGVPEDTIVADYSLSNHFHAHFDEIVNHQMERFFRLGLSIDDVYPLTLADPQTMHTALGYIRDHYGDVQTYLHVRAGVDEDALARLRDALLE